VSHWVGAKVERFEMEQLGQELLARGSAGAEKPPVTGNFHFRSDDCKILDGHCFAA